MGKLYLEFSRIAFMEEPKKEKQAQPNWREFCWKYLSEKLVLIQYYKP